MNDLQKTAKDHLYNAIAGIWIGFYSQMTNIS